ncbi:MAG: PEP-CTERM sorting domain-containing protein [Phycisphaerales bacterium]|nr:PEP-CTERM sorting domain-containing protein [Phycisphaerales bacterium]
MNKIATIAGLAVAASAMTASADVLLLVDLSVADTITISATDGVSSADGSASNFTGFLLAGFYNTLGAGIADTSVSGDLSTAANASDGSADIFNGGSSFGLNVWSVSTDSTLGVTAGATAFAGSTTWTVSAADYAELLAGNMSGDIIFGADTDDDDGVNIGTWAIVPAPGSLALLGLGGIAAGRRRR